MTDHYRIIRKEINLTPEELEQLEKEIEENQNSQIKWIDDYEYKVRRLENFVSILENTRNQNITKLKQEIKLIYLFEISWENCKADSINLTISLTGYLMIK